MRVKKGEEDVINFCYKTSVNQLNELLDAAISERVRVLARSKTYLEAYNTVLQTVIICKITVKNN